jgi:hypothetical protein
MAITHLLLARSIGFYDCALVKSRGLFCHPARLATMAISLAPSGLSARSRMGPPSGSKMSSKVKKGQHPRSKTMNSARLGIPGGPDARQTRPDRLGPRGVNTEQITTISLPIYKHSRASLPRRADRRRHPKGGTSQRLKFAR